MAHISRYDGSTARTTTVTTDITAIAATDGYRTVMDSLTCALESWVVDVHQDTKRTFLIDVFDGLWGG